MNRTGLTEKPLDIKREKGWKDAASATPDRRNDRWRAACGRQERARPIRIGKTDSLASPTDRPSSMKPPDSPKRK
jgi:hypothetical protein